MADDIQQPPAAPEVNPQAFSAKMYDHAGQKWVEVPADQVEDRVRSGKFTFESGIRIPVVSPEGQVGTIASDAAYDEFTNKGMKWVTPAIKEADHGQKERQIIEDRFGDQPINAIIAGGLRSASLGASDALMSAASPDLGDALKATAETNPGATMVGEGIGMLAPVGPAAGAIKVGEHVGAHVAENLAAAGVSKVGEKIISKAAQGAVEGAHFGLGQGVSEAALGHPDDVVDSLVSHVGAGALFGGIAGTVFGSASASRPYFDQLVEKGTTGFKSVADKVAHTAGMSAIKASLDRKGMEELSARVGEITPELLQKVAEEGGVKPFLKKMDGLKPDMQVVKDLQRGVQGDLRKAIRDVSEETQNIVAGAVDKAGGDILQASKAADEAYRGSQATFGEITASQRNPTVFEPADLNKFVEDTIDKLSSSNASAKAVASKLEGRQALSYHPSDGGEAAYLQDLSTTLKEASRKGLGHEDRSLIDSVTKQIDDTLESHPNPLIAHTYQDVKRFSEANKLLSDVADGALTRQAGGDAVYSGAKAFKTLTNPANHALVDATFNNLEQLAPEFSAYSQGFKNLKDKLALRQQIETKMREFVPGQRIDGDKVLEIFDMLGKAPGDLSKRLQQVKEVNAALQGESPISRAIGVKKALGQPIGEDLKHLATMERPYDVLKKLSGVDAPGWSPQKTAMGVVAGSLLGPGAAKVVGLVSGVQKSNLGRYADVLGQVYKATDRGQKLIEAGVKGASKALTSPAAFRGVMTGTHLADKKATMKEMRKSFEGLKKALPEMAQMPTPANSTYTPQISKALENRQQQVAKFLQDKLPIDPFEQTSMSLFDTGYQPPDREISKFYRYLKAAENPLNVLMAVKDGTVSQEEIETLKTIYPKIYESLQTTVLDGIIKGGSKLSYQQKIQLGTLFDIPTDYSLQPGVIARFQQNINKDEGGRPDGTGGNRKISIDLNPTETVATATSNLTNK